VSADVRRVTDDKQRYVPRQPSSSKALNMNPSVNEQEQKQMQDTTAQKNKS
jgi:hypothetical protein